jgi:hypothetical protein
MRSILALCLLIALCASANAATVHHAHRHTNVYSGEGLTPGSISSWAYAPAGQRNHYQPRLEFDDQTPSPYDNRYQNWGG